MSNIVTVKIPATTANIGAGFDTFGMALAYYNTVQMKTGCNFKSLRITNLGQSIASLQDVNRNLVAVAAKKLWGRVGFCYDGIELILENVIPVSRGLGSSAAAIVGGLVAANEVAGRPFDQAAILEMAADMEGHPDNVAPALMGGFVSSCRRDDDIIVLKATPPAALKVVVAIPDFYLSTRVAREAMPKSIPVEDAVHNIQCASLIMGAMMSGDLELLGKAVDDKIHQPYRLPLIKGAEAVLSVAKDAGALAAVLSGAGPTLIAFTDTDGQAIKQAMATAWQHAGVKCEVLILEQDNQGVQIL